MKQQYIMVLGASYNQLPAIHAVKNLGYKCIAIDIKKDSIGFKYSDVYFVNSILDFDYIYEIGKKFSVEAIVTTASEKAMLTIANVCPKLGLISPSKDTIEKATNKAKMRICFKENNVPSPDFKVVDNYGAFIDAVKYFSNDCISKAANNSGKRGIIRVSKSDSRKQLKRAFDYSFSNSTSKQIVVEEIMRGEEFSVESITYNGKTTVVAITGRNKGKPPHFLEEYHYQPALISMQLKKEIEWVVKKAIKAIGLENGATHTEVMSTSSGVKVVEIGARLGGDNITSSLTPLSTGVDITTCMIMVYLGKKPNLEHKANNAAAIKYYFPKNGIVKNITGIDQIPMCKGVVEYQIDIKNGTNIRGPIDNQERMGFVIATAKKPLTALNRCKQALSKIKIDYE